MKTTLTIIILILSGIICAFGQPLSTGPESFGPCEAVKSNQSTFSIPIIVQ